MYIFKYIIVVMVISLYMMTVHADSTKQNLIESAKSAGPEVITKNATIKIMGGETLVEGSNGWICYAGSKSMGPMCNQPPWDKLISSLLKKETPELKDFSISYMMAGEGDAAGVSNIDPYAAGPTKDNDWIKEGPHLMIILPDQRLLEGISTDPADPVYVMWKGTPYAHLMVKIGSAM